MADKSKEPKDPHPGCVKRVLCHQERLIILNATAEALKGKGTVVLLARQHKLNELLDAEGVESYYESMNQDLGRRLEKYRAALIEFRESKGAGKDPGKQPKHSKAETRGKDATYWIPSKLDSFIIETLKKAEIPSGHTEFVVELAEKYGIPVEE